MSNFELVAVDASTRIWWWGLVLLYVHAGFTVFSAMQHYGAFRRPGSLSPAAGFCLCLLFWWTMFFYQTGPDRKLQLTPYKPRCSCGHWYSLHEPGGGCRLGTCYCRRYHADPDAAEPI